MYNKVYKITYFEKSKQYKSTYNKYHTEIKYSEQSICNKVTRILFGTTYITGYIE